jgi:uncharacterized protein RhaS with RHS repeats
MYRDAYSPGIGRFPQSDPIGIQGGNNTYAYVESSPLAWADRTGEAKGGKQNISAEGFNKRSDPKEVEKAMKEAKQAGNIKSYRALRALLKVIKRGGMMGFCAALFDQILDMQECQEDPCSCDDPNVRNMNGCT